MVNDLKQLNYRKKYYYSLQMNDLNILCCFLSNQQVNVLSTQYIKSCLTSGINTYHLFSIVSTSVQNKQTHANKNKGYVVDLNTLKTRGKEEWCYLKSEGGKDDAIQKVREVRVILFKKSGKEGWCYLKSEGGKDDAIQKVREVRVILFKKSGKEGWCY